MQNGIQSWYKALGDWGCYFLCLIEIAERCTGNKFDVIETAIMVSKKGYMKLDITNLKDDDNFYILHPEKILEYLTGNKWVCTWQPATYIPTPEDYVIRCNKRGRTTHFNMSDFDSLQNSVTVKYGKLDSYRIFRKVA